MLAQWKTWTADCSQLALAACSATAVVAVAAYRHLFRARVRPAGGVVLITGCDSGLGFSLALHAQRQGFTVFAGVLQPQGAGAGRLAEQRGGPPVRLLPLDVTDRDSVRAAVAAVERALSEEPGLWFHALVNNAGVMVFGEFEWQTEAQVRHQLEVNLLGTMRVTHAFCPLLRKYAGRVVTVSSHCTQVSLPGVAVYGATKAGVAAWSDALRIELAKFGVRVVQVLPGSFFAHSGLLARQQQHAAEMEEAMTDEQHQFYGEYFKRYQAYLRPLGDACACSAESPSAVPDAGINAALDSALALVSPQAVYERAPLRYRVYHTLCRISPSTALRDALVRRFVGLPSWKLGNRHNGIFCKVLTSLVASVACLLRYTVATSIERFPTQHTLSCAGSGMLQWAVVASLLTAAGALYCYQCVSDSRDEEPLCDTQFWGQTTQRERHDMLTICPKHFSAFCTKVVVVGSSYTHTSRGCFSATDDMGARLGEGCAIMPHDDIETTACFCNTHACNGTESLPLPQVLAYAVVLAIASGMLN